MPVRVQEQASSLTHAATPLASLPCPGRPGRVPCLVCNCPCWDALEPGVECACMQARNSVHTKAVAALQLAGHAPVRRPTWRCMCPALGGRHAPDMHPRSEHASEPWNSHMATAAFGHSGRCCAQGRRESDIGCGCSHAGQASTAGKGARAGTQPGSPGPASHCSIDDTSLLRGGGAACGTPRGTRGAHASGG